MKHVAVHADDFGLSAGANEAITDLMASGAIQSTTLMANGAAFEDAVRRLGDDLVDQPVGLHANLTQHRPVGAAEGLRPVLDEEGAFSGRRSLWRACQKRQVGLDALVAEVEAQWARCEAAGIRPTHIDTHQHAHAIPLVFRAVQRVADAHSVPVRRLRLPTHLGPWARRLKSVALNAAAKRGERAAAVPAKANLELLSIFMVDALPSIEAYRSLLEASERDFIELMVHPARVDSEHRMTTRISEISAADYEVLGSDAWRSFLNESPFHFLPAHELIRAATQGVR